MFGKHCSYFPKIIDFIMCVLKNQEFLNLVSPAFPVSSSNDIVVQFNSQHSKTHEHTATVYVLSSVNTSIRDKKGP